MREALLSQYPEYRAPSHWHDDIEFICVLLGGMKYNVNGEIVNLKKGEGIFVNSGQMHSGFSDNGQECGCLAAGDSVPASSSVPEPEFPYRSSARPVVLRPDLVAAAGTCTGGQRERKAAESGSDNCKKHDRIYSEKLQKKDLSCGDRFVRRIRRRQLFCRNISQKDGDKPHGVPQAGSVNRFELHRAREL